MCYWARMLMETLEQVSKVDMGRKASNRASIYPRLTIVNSTSLIISWLCSLISQGLRGRDCSEPAAEGEMLLLAIPNVTGEALGVFIPISPPSYGLRAATALF